MSFWDYSLESTGRTRIVSIQYQEPCGRAKKPVFMRVCVVLTVIPTQWDKLSPTEEYAIEYAHAHINEEPERMIDANHYSLEYCLAHSGETINDRYRQDRPESIEQEIAAMVATHTTDTDLVLYRGVCKNVFELMKENAAIVGDCDLYEKSFLQTSLVKGHESNAEIKLRIYAPAGTKAIYLGNVNYEQNYYEVDIMLDSKLKIISIDNDYINCELLTTA